MKWLVFLWQWGKIFSNFPAGRNCSIIFVFVLFCLLQLIKILSYSPFQSIANGSKQYKDPGQSEGLFVEAIANFSSRISLRITVIKKGWAPLCKCPKRLNRDERKADKWPQYILHLASPFECALQDFQTNVWLPCWIQIFEFFEDLGARKGGDRECIGLEQFKAS